MSPHCYRRKIEDHRRTNHHFFWHLENLLFRGNNGFAESIYNARAFYSAAHSKRHFPAALMRIGPHERSSIAAGSAAHRSSSMTRDPPIWGIGDNQPSTNSPPGGFSAGNTQFIRPTKQILQHAKMFSRLKAAFSSTLALAHQIHSQLVAANLYQNLVAHEIQNPF